MSREHTVACYYFPSYHADPRNEAVHGPGWTEWELVRRAGPRFKGHDQPRVPLWRYGDEADPAVMATKIAAAADHGIDAWIFDWYWYDDGPFLERALDEGYLGAPNNSRLRFGLMWANHDWVDIHPAKLNETGQAKLVYPGSVTLQTFETFTDLVIERYFRHPSYWMLDDCPYFSVYDLAKLRAGLGGLASTRAALSRFRSKVKKAGFRDLHLNAVVWSAQLLPGESAVSDPNELVNALGFDSLTSYVWVHHSALEAFPQTTYVSARDTYLAYWESVERTFDLPYHPNVTVGWDPSPRTVQSDAYLNVGYPFTSTLAGNTPDQFRKALWLVRERLDRSVQQHKVLTLNAWNEWTEGSYLEPDQKWGMAYLEAIRDVLCD